jgi:membrane-associated protein
MDSLIHFFQTLYSSDGLKSLIQSGGLPTLALIVFAETGMLLGLFLPGDSLLVAAGVVAAQQTSDGGHVLNIVLLNVCLVTAAILGNQTGYWLGSKTGPSIFSRPDSRVFKKRYAVEAHEFYLQHGGKAIVMACFIPILRTFVPFIAGVAEMPYSRFVGFNILGATVWVTLMLWSGYLLGPYVGKQLHYFILLVVFVSFLPLIIGGMKRWMKTRTAADIA